MIFYVKTQIGINHGEEEENSLELAGLQELHVFIGMDWCGLRAMAWTAAQGPVLFGLGQLDCKPARFNFEWGTGCGCGHTHARPDISCPTT